MRTQVLNWMNKGTTKSLSALCMNKGHRESVRSCRGSEIQQGSYESTHQVPRVEVKTVQKPLVCWVLRAQRWCSARCSMTCTEVPGAGAGGGPGRGGGRLSAPLTRLTLSWVQLWSRVGDVLTLSQPLGYSSEVETACRQLIKIQCGEDSNEELNSRMLRIQKLVNNEKEKNIAL